MAQSALLALVENTILTVYVETGSDVMALDAGYALALRKSTARQAMNAVVLASANLGL